MLSVKETEQSQCQRMHLKLHVFTVVCIAGWKLFALTIQLSVKLAFLKKQYFMYQIFNIFLFIFATVFFQLLTL